MSRQQRSPSADGPSPIASTEWSNVEDSEERRRIQNRVAQRRYRERVKNSSHHGKRRDNDISITMPITESSLEQHSHFPSLGNGSILDHDASANVPWLLDPMRTQNADYRHVLREPDSQYPRSPASYEHYSSMQFPSFNPLATPLSSNVGSNHDFNSYNSLTLPPSPSLMVQPDNPSHDHVNSPTQPKHNKRRSEFQLPQRERGGSTKDQPRTREQTSPISNNTKSTSSNQHKNGAQKACQPGRKGGQRNSRSSKHATTPDDMSKELTKTCEKAQKELMRQAYQRGRSEAIASFGKQRSRLQSRAQELMEGVIETVDFGVSLEVFERDAKLDRALKEVKVHLQSLSQPGNGVFRNGEGGLERSGRRDVDESEEDGSEDGEEGEDR